MTSTPLMQKGRRGVAMAVLALSTLALGAQATELEPVENQGPALDDFTTGRHRSAERTPLKYAPVREADVLWEKRVWRVIDTREKMNLPFVAPESPLFSILTEAARAGELPLYSTENDRFTIPLSVADLENILSTRDTVLTINVVTGEEETRIVHNEMSWEDVKRFRIKEVWWFDAAAGQLRQRILGIAPLMEVKNDQGDFLYERPMFWVHYPSAREVLARHPAIASDNVSAGITWEDLMEMRYFASYITKENNVHDRRLQDYLAGVDLLMEGDKISDALFNMEHDLWSW